MFAEPYFNFSLIPVANVLEGTNSSVEICAVATFSLASLECPVTVSVLPINGPLTGKL